MNEELYIDGKLADIGEAKILLNFKSNILSDITKVESNTTLTINLPKTQNNLRIIQHVEQLAEYDNRWAWRYHSVTYRRGGVTIIENAQLYITAVDEDIRCTIIWGLYEAFSKLTKNDLTLNKLSGDTLITWNGDDEPDDWEVARYADVFYADINMFYEELMENYWEYDTSAQKRKLSDKFGGRRGNTKYASRHPLVSVNYILSRIAYDCNISLNFPERAQAVIDRMCVPLVSRKANEQSFPTPTIANNGFSQIVTAGESSLNVLNVDNSLFNVIVEDGITKLQVKYSMDFDISIAGTIDYDFTNFPVTHGRWLYVGANYVIKVRRGENFEYYNCGAMWSGSNEVVAADVPSKRIIDNVRGNGIVALEKDDVISVGCYYTEYAFGSRRDDYDPEQHTTPTERTPVTTWNPMTMTLRVASVDGEVPYGGLYPVEENLPEIKVADFIKFLCSYLGVFPRQLPSKVSINFAHLSEPFDTANYVDWTRRLVAQRSENEAKQVEFRVSGWARRNWLRWKEDERTPIDENLCIEIDDETMEFERTIMTYPFAASQVNNVPCYQWQEGFPQYKACKPRLLRIEPTADGKTRAVFDTDWAARLMEDCELLYNSLGDTKMVTERLMLSDIDVQNFDELRPVFLAQYGAFFVVQSIKQSSETAAEVTMLRVKSLYDSRVEWIASSGTQWINTGLKPAAEVVELRFRMRDISASVGIWGSRIAMSNKPAVLYTNTTPNFVCRFGTTGSRTIAEADTYWHTIIFDMVAGTAQIDGGEPHDVGVYEQNDLEMFLFALNQNGAARYQSEMELAYAKFGERLDLVPVRIGRVGYLYDRISGRIFGNSGTGDFECGDDI